MTSLIKRNSIFPSLFSLDGISDLFGEIEKEMMYSTPSHSYPTDIVEILDENGKASGYEINIAGAGISKDNVNIDIEDDVLNINIEKKSEIEDKNRKYLKKGISYRSMKTRYGLHGINKEKIDAKFDNGLLKISLPLNEEVKPKQIEIK